jgi:hypothetical protein
MPRALRITTATGLLWVGLAVGAPTAAADGGAYIDLNRTHYLPGETAVAKTYVTVPRGKLELLQRGPFHTYLVTGRTWPQEGRPIPQDAIRVGTFAVEHDRGTTFEFTAHLSIPDVPGALYGLAVCNDPCTVSGFREPITGTVSIVQTPREAILLDERQHLEVRMANLRGELRKREKELEALQAEFDARERDRVYLTSEVNRLNHTLDRVDENAAARLLVGGWAAGIACAMVAAGATLVLFIRRRARPGRVSGRSRVTEPVASDGAERRPSVSSAAHGPSDDVPAGPGPADRRRGARLGDRMDPVRP